MLESNLPHLVRRIENLDELKALWRIDAEGYGESAISMETFASWWRAYPAGITAHFVGEEVIGAVGAWPLREGVLDQLTSGKIREAEIGAAHFGPPSTCDWYISGVILRPVARRSRAVLPRLLSVVFGNLLSAGASPTALRVAALAYSPQGKALLSRGGFQHRGTTADDLPLYVIDSAGLARFHQRLLCSRALSPLLPTRPAAEEGERLGRLISPLDNMTNPKAGFIHNAGYGKRQQLQAAAAPVWPAVIALPIDNTLYRDWMATRTQTPAPENWAPPGATVLMPTMQSPLPPTFPPGPSAAEEQEDEDEGESLGA